MKSKKNYMDVDGTPGFIGRHIDTSRIHRVYFNNNIHLLDKALLNRRNIWDLRSPCYGPTKA
jgi:hypothetical protein